MKSVRLLNNDRGFTLIEIIIVAAIIGLIGIVGYMSYGNMGGQVNVAQVTSSSPRPSQAATSDRYVTWTPAKSESGLYSLKFPPQWRKYTYSAIAGADCPLGDTMLFAVEPADRATVSGCGGGRIAPVEVKVQGISDYELEPTFYDDIKVAQVTANGHVGRMQSGTLRHGTAEGSAGDRYTEYTFRIRTQNVSLSVVEPGDQSHNAALLDELVKNTLMFTTP